MTEPTMTSRALMVHWLNENTDYGYGGASGEEVMQNFEQSSWLAERDTKALIDFRTDRDEVGRRLVAIQAAIDRAYNNPDNPMSQEISEGLHRHFCAILRGETPTEDGDL